LRQRRQVPTPRSHIPRTPCLPGNALQLISPTLGSCIPFLTKIPIKSVCQRVVREQLKLHSSDSSVTNCSSCFKVVSMTTIAVFSAIVRDCRSKFTLFCSCSDLFSSVLYLLTCSAQPSRAEVPTCLRASNPLRPNLIAIQKQCITQLAPHRLS
jgi:hypothetical protein